MPRFSALYCIERLSIKSHDKYFTRDGRKVKGLSSGNFALREIEFTIDSRGLHLKMYTLVAYSSRVLLSSNKIIIHNIFNILLYCKNIAFFFYCAPCELYTSLLQMLSVNCVMLYLNFALNFFFSRFKYFNET